MTKRLMKGMAALCICAAFVSCSHDTDFEAANQSAFVDNLKNEYKAAFIKKYGEIDPNQSWDFTNYGKETRGGAESVTHSRVELFTNFKKLVKDDRDAVKAIDFTTTDDLKPWNPNLSVTLYPALCHAIPNVKYTYYHIGIVENGNSPYDVLQTINTKSGFWYDAQSNNGTMNANSGRIINSKALQTGNNTYWVAYYTYPTTGQQEYKDGNKNVMDNISSFKIEYYKEIVVNGDKFWCFDCNDDGDFSDLICLVQDADPLPIQKRYMIEDLGGDNDFDFNDIVVDVIQESNGSQKAIIRAMGGTLQITLKIGNTEYTKSGLGFNIEEMYNTKPTIDFSANLAEFEVSGWDFNANNITVTVDNIQNSGVKTVIPFPREGEAPMIAAFDPVTTHWNEERVPLDLDWYKPLEEASSAE